MFQKPLPNLFPVPILGFQLPLLGIITFNPIFDAAIDHFQEYGLWACPSAPYSSQDGGKKENENDKGDGKDGKQNKVLRPECKAKNDELALKYIQQEEGFTVDFDPRNAKKDDQ